MSLIKDDYERIFSDVNKVLVVTAHPDDCEIICGGTVARLMSEGKSVRLVVTSPGGKGTKDKIVDEKVFSETRKMEQINGGLALGIKKEENFNLGIKDGEVEHTLENIGIIARHIREFKPDLVITHNPMDTIIDFSESSHWVNHRDHRNTGLITLDACYPYSRDNGFFPEQLAEGLTSHSVHKFMFSDAYNRSNIVNLQMDNFVENKRNAFKCHQSVINSESVEDFVEENKTDNGYFEVLGYVEIY